MLVRWPRPSFYAVILLVVALDQLTKAWVSATFQPEMSSALIPGFFNLTYVQNTGIAFGMFKGQGLFVALFVVGLFPPDFPQLAYTVTIAFVSAFQVTTFRRVGRFTYNSTFVTGNLRMVAEGIFDRLFSPFQETRSKGYAQAWKLGLICSSFFIGALVGAFVAPRYPAHAILFAEPLLVVTAILVLLSPSPAPEAAPRVR